MNGKEQDIVSQVKEQSDIVQIIGEHVELKKSGVRFLGLCPFHGEKTPSFSVHSGQQFFHCFGCGESGDVLSFLMKYHSWDFPTALKALADKYNIILPERKYSKREEQLRKKKDALFNVTKKAAKLFHEYLAQNSGSEPARKYLKDRGVSKKIYEKFFLGYSPAVEQVGWNFLGTTLSNKEIKDGVESGLVVKKEKGGTYDRFRDRIVFPIFDISGRICGFGGRIVGEGQPKYLNSPESPIFNKSKLLLGLYQQKEEIRKAGSAILVEGNFDLISLVAAGCTNVVAPLGTALTKEQLRLLKRFADEVVLLFDGDSAGERAAIRSIPLFLAEQMTGKVALLPEGDDPDSFVRKNGLKSLQELLGSAESLPEFMLESLVKTHGLTFDGKRKIVGELQQLTQTAPKIQRTLFVSHFSSRLGLEQKELEEMLGVGAAQSSSPLTSKLEKKKKEKVEPLSMAQKQLVEFMILYPQYFGVLDENGIRQCLAGSTGEILYLRLKSLFSKNNEVEPEDLLTVMEDGAERDFVAEVLLKSSALPPDVDHENFDTVLGDLLKYLKRFHLLRRSDELIELIQEAQRGGDIDSYQKLMMEKIEVTNKIQDADI